MYDHFEMKDPASISGGASSGEGLADQPLAGSTDILTNLIPNTSPLLKGRPYTVKTANTRASIDDQTKGNAWLTTD